MFSKTDLRPILQAELPKLTDDTHFECIDEIDMFLVDAQTRDKERYESTYYLLYIDGFENGHYALVCKDDDRIIGAGISNLSRNIYQCYKHLKDQDDDCTIKMLVGIPLQNHCLVTTNSLHEESYYAIPEHRQQELQKLEDEDALYYFLGSPINRVRSNGRPAKVDRWGIVRFPKEFVMLNKAGRTCR